MSQSPFPPGPTPPYRPGPPPPPKKTNTTLIVLLIVGGLVVLCCGGGFVSRLSDGDDEGERATTTRPAPAAAPRTSASASTTTRAAAGPTPSDPRCAPAAETIVATVVAGLKVAGNRLTNGTVLTQGKYTYFGATVVDAAGEIESRSDVWVLDGGVPFAPTGGARRETIFPHASDVLGVGPGDEPVAAVDNCVVNATLGR